MATASSTKNSGGSSSGGTKGPILPKQGSVKPSFGVMGSSYVPGQSKTSVTSTAPKGPTGPATTPKTTGATAPATTGSTGSTGIPYIPPIVDNTFQKTDWIEQLSILFKNYGLETLAPKIQDFVKQGYSPDTVTLKLQETPEYQQRFSGNAARIKAGLSVLSPAEYLATEASYRQIMRSAGLPAGFYDSSEDFSNFIAKDVAPTELKQRVDLAALSLDNADPYFTKSLQDMYGLSSGEMIAHVLDPERAMPMITRQVQASQFGAAAARQGLNVGKNAAEEFANIGVSQQQAEQGFQQIAQMIPDANKLSNIYGARVGTYGQAEAMAETFGGAGGAEAAIRRKKLSQMETAQFSGSSGTGKSSFAQQQTGQI